MNIIHYSLGLHPERSGGLTRYATDLIQAQQQSANVTLLYAQGWVLGSKNISWSRVGQRSGIECYALRNTLPYPIPLHYGVREPQDFMYGRTMTHAVMESLYNEIKPDVFHVHTLMGLPKELLVFFKSKGVKLIYTAHDYFGFCPKVNMINSRGEVCESPSESRCKECNLDSKPTILLRLYNSKIALQIKNYVKNRL